MSASEPALAMRDIRCPRCLRPIHQPLLPPRPLPTALVEVLVDRLLHPMLVLCEPPMCDWSGTVIWADVVEVTGKDRDD